MPCSKATIQPVSYTHLDVYKRQKLKSIERLKERRFAEYLEEQLHEEQKQLDEIGLQLYVRAEK